jgi:hypothetical protein
MSIGAPFRHLRLKGCEVRATATQDAINHYRHPVWPNGKSFAAVTGILAHYDSSLESRELIKRTLEQLLVKELRNLYATEQLLQSALAAAGEGHES